MTPLQVAACFVVAVSFAVHVFFNPYKKVFQNVIETFVLFNYIILLLVRSTQTFLDSFMDSSNSLDYTGTGVSVQIYLSSENLCVKDADNKGWTYWLGSCLFQA